MKKKHNILKKVKEFCIEVGIPYKEIEGGLDFELVRVWRLEKSGYRGINKRSGVEIRLNTQKEIINFLQFYYIYKR